MNSNGLAIIKVDESETRSVFIDQDALECARLNALTKKRAKEAAREARRKAKLEARRVQAVRYILSRCAISVAVTLAMFAGMIHPVVSVPVAAICVCTACVRLGEWLGRNADEK